MKKNLIYTIAYGSQAWHQCCLMATSLREIGQFDGDLHVYSDIDAGMNGAKVLYRPDLGETFTIMGCRWQIGSTMDVSSYEQVAMIDSDVVAVAPINGLFDYEPGSVFCPADCTDDVSPVGHSPWTIIGIDFDRNNPVFNCGTVFGSANEWNSFSGLMWNLIRSFRKNIPYPYQWIDQQVLNHIASHKMFNIQPMTGKPIAVFSRAAGVEPDTKLVHCIPGGEGKLQVMRMIYSMAKDWHPPKPDYQPSPEI